MSTFTENYSLIKPDTDDYYDVTDFNENMDTIDTLMAVAEAEQQKISEKIGSPEDTDNSTLFGCLNAGGSLVKSIQTLICDTQSNAGTLTQKLEKTVNPSRCLVFLDRQIDWSGLKAKVTYTLSEESLSITCSYDNGAYNLSLRFQIIEFY